MKKIIVLVLMLHTILMSCDDISISKKDLLTKSWILDETTLNGEFYNHEAIYLKNSTYTFLDDETVKIVISQSSDILTGTWQLLNNNTELTIAFSGVINEYNIERLDNSGLWLSKTESKDVFMYKFCKAVLE